MGGGEEEGRGGEGGVLGGRFTAGDGVVSICFVDSVFV